MPKKEKNDKLIPHCCLIEERHKELLEQLRFHHKLNFSEIVREGIELVAEKHGVKKNETYRF